MLSSYPVCLGSSGQAPMFSGVKKYTSIIELLVILRITLNKVMPSRIPGLVMIMTIISSSWMWVGSASAQERTTVCFESNLGNFCAELYDDITPLTVANFLNYVERGDYDGTIIHRNIPSFVVQGGGYYFNDATKLAEQVSADPAVQNEFKESNLRGTLAMAKLGNDPNSATNEWFINLADNSFNLDNQNGGFTVFAKVLGNGMSVVDAIAARTTLDYSGTLGSAFTDVPIVRSDGDLTSNDFVIFTKVYVADSSNLPPTGLLGEELGYFNGYTFTAAVEYRGKLYRMSFDLVGTPPDYRFKLRQNQIYRLTDTNQERAVYSDGILSIPTIIYRSQTYGNLMLELTDQATWEFTLRSFERR